MDHSLFMTNVESYWDMINFGGILAAFLTIASVTAIFFIVKRMANMDSQEARQDVKR